MCCDLGRLTMSEEKHVQGQETAARRCQQCGKMFQGHFCGHCGAKATDIITFCPVCGQDRTPELAFCTNCGFSYGGTMEVRPDAVKRTAQVPRTAKTQAPSTPATILTPKPAPAQNGGDKWSMLPSDQVTAKNGVIYVRATNHQKSTHNPFAVPPTGQPEQGAPVPSTLGMPKAQGGTASFASQPPADVYAASAVPATALTKPPKEKKPLPKWAKWTMIGVLAALIIAVLCFTLLQPVFKMGKANRLAKQGKIEEALEIYTSLDGYGESETYADLLTTANRYFRKGGLLKTGVTRVLDKGVPVTISYTMNGGKFGTFQGNEIIEHHYAKKNEFGGLSVPVREGYRFDEWVFDGYTFDKKNGVTLTVHASWEITEYTIAYQLNGGTNTAKNPVTYTMEDEFTLKAPRKDGFVFVGWTIYGEQEEPQKELTIEEGTTGNITLVAHWETAVYTITLQAAGGILEETEFQIGLNETYNLPIPTRSDAVFLGWYSGNTLYENTGVWQVTSDMTLTAKWSSGMYTISYELNGGTNGKNNPTIGIPEGVYTFAHPSKEGYLFIGWTYEGQDNRVVNLTIQDGIHQDITMTAHWQARSCTVSFNANGGTVQPVQMSMTYGDPYSLPTPTRGGYTFDGWYNGNELHEVTPTWTGLSNVQLTAKWKANTYNITFDTAGGEAIAPIQATYGKTYSLPTPVREGYTFAGWYQGENKIANSGTWLVTADISLTARWIDASSYETVVVEGENTIYFTTEEISANSAIRSLNVAELGDYLFPSENLYISSIEDASGNKIARNADATYTLDEGVYTITFGALKTFGVTADTPQFLTMEKRENV